jgi:hypothetical protein
MQGFLYVDRDQGSARLWASICLSFHNLVRRMLTKDLMISKVVTVNPGNSIWHAAQKMLACFVVDDSGHRGMLPKNLLAIELGIRTVIFWAATAYVSP